jgi:hypothetical protein
MTIFEDVHGIIKYISILTVVIHLMRIFIEDTL